MYRFASNDGLDLDELRTRLRKVSDDELVFFGKHCSAHVPWLQHGFELRLTLN